MTPANDEAAHWKANHDYQVGLKYRQHEYMERLREALKEVAQTLGPTAPEHPGHCQGCTVEIGMALDIANAVLPRKATGMVKQVVTGVRVA